MFTFLLLSVCFFGQVLPSHIYSNINKINNERYRNLRDTYQFTTSVGPPEYDEINTTTLPLILFRQENNTRVIAEDMSLVVLHCLAENVGKNRQVWVRLRDYEILTVGVNTYTKDPRFTARLIANNKIQDMELHIYNARKHDEGIYECQISSGSQFSLMTRLTIVEPTSEILGGPEQYLRRGSSLKLVCVFRNNIHPPSHVYWYYGDWIINYFQEVETNENISSLFISDMQPQDSGNYSCWPSNASPSSIQIHITEDEEMPAATHSVSCVPTNNQHLAFTFLIAMFAVSHFK